MGIPLRSVKEAARVAKAKRCSEIQRRMEDFFGEPLGKTCERLACKEIADQANMDYMLVYNFLKDMKYTPRKVSEYSQQVRRGRKKVDDDKLRELYVDKKLNMQQVGDYFGITKGAVCLHCQRLGISRSASQASKVVTDNLTPEERLARKERQSDRQLLRIATSKKKYSHTDIERKFIAWCNLNAIEYTNQYRIKGIRHVYDFYIPHLNYIIEVDGDYWHSSPAQLTRDSMFTAAAANLGYTVVRFLRSDINKSKSTCFDSLITSVSTPGVET
jgi:very-short-patch-repair endonuclease